MKRTIVILFLLICWLFSAALGAGTGLRSEKIPTRFSDPLLEMVTARSVYPQLLGGIQAGGVLPSEGMNKLVSISTSGGVERISCLL